MSHFIADWILQEFHYTAECTAARLQGGDDWEGRQIKEMLCGANQIEDDIVLII